LSLFFVDTSALAKRYVPEIGSNWIRGLVAPTIGHIIFISNLATVEMISLLTRREREGFISTTDRTYLQRDFLFHVQNEYLVVDLNDSVIGRARDLLIKYPLRALDSLQLASAMEVLQDFKLAPTFVSADTRLLTAASAEGLPIDDPNTHP